MTDNQLIDELAVLNQLKDFQRATVEYLFQRMYLDEQSARRFLVADEVGLGKTMIARGFLAKAINHLRNQGTKRIDVVYVCSNLEIANQNIRKLAKIYPGTHHARATRLTLLPLELDLMDDDINFISLTPSTSLDMMGNRQGQARERALLFQLLQNHPDNRWHWSGEAPYKVLQGQMYRGNFKWEVDQIDFAKVDSGLKKPFYASLTQDHLKAWRELCDGLSGRSLLKHRTSHFKWMRRRFVSDMLNILAVNCITMMEPDVIILDEFQRFRNILSSDDDDNSLAKPLFEYEDPDSQLRTRVLMLSATPYKMYTTNYENSAEDSDHHYRDFLETIRFLSQKDEMVDQLKNHLDGYNTAFNNIVHGDTDAQSSVVEHKREIENLLRQVMVRTERLASTPNRNGMLKEVEMSTSDVRASDFQSYIGLQQIAQQVQQPSVINYWKSGAYLLNFMRQYQLKVKFRDAIKSDNTRAQVSQILERNESVLLSKETIDNYEVLDPGNPAIRALLNQVQDWWSLLWIPPSLSYYQLSGVFADKSDVTKRLIFSSWRIVPRVLATLLSYEIDRQIMTRAYDNISDIPNQHTVPLRFNTLDDNRSDINYIPRPPEMHTLNLMYPSVYLTEECDPLNFGSSPVPTFEQIQNNISEKIQEGLNNCRLEEYITDHDRVDDSWYWIAPLLLDLHHNPDATTRWIKRDSLADDWAVHDEEIGAGWRDLVQYFRSTVDALENRSLILGKPPEDLVQKLAVLALGNPAVVAFRALSRFVTDPQAVYVRDNAGTIAWLMRKLFNRREATYRLRAIYQDSTVINWHEVVQYAAEGGLQAVLDEYFYLLAEIARPVEDEKELVETIVYFATEPLELRQGRLKVDYFNFNDGEIDSEIEEQWHNNHFAMSLTDPTEDSAQSESSSSWASKVRSGFNSPFVPFVIATTSIGQEGLDFHRYSHAVVHWNLPYNPVDMEQREGRVHRYKGHAVRKNLAAFHKEQVFSQNGINESDGHIWDKLFDLGEQNKKLDDTDMIPYWIYNPESNGYQIERYVPLVPFSRDWDKLKNLKQALVFYRMVFGQPRQEDLLQAILSQHGLEDLLDDLELQIDLSPSSFHGT